jgi:hypothetical protein
MKRTAAPLAAAALFALGAAAFAATSPTASPAAADHPRILRPNVALRFDPNALEVDPPSAVETPLPKPAEWKDAPQIRLAHDVDACRAYRVREWVKIHCSGFPAAGVSLLAGPSKGVEVWVDPPKEPNENMKTPRDAEVIFPVRRGDGRLIQIGQFGEGYDGPVAWNLAYTISEQWIEDERAPIITVR